MLIAPLAGLFVGAIGAIIGASFGMVAALIKDDFMEDSLLRIWIKRGAIIGFAIFYVVFLSEFMNF